MPKQSNQIVRALQEGSVGPLDGAASGRRGPRYRSVHEHRSERGTKGKMKGNGKNRQIGDVP